MFLRKLFRKFILSPRGATTEKILEKLNDIKNLAQILSSIFYIELISRNLHMTLDPTVQAALDAAKQKITDAITKEVQDVKDLVTGGANTADIVAALDDLGTSVASSIDTISTGGASPGNTTTTG